MKALLKWTALAALVLSPALGTAQERPADGEKVDWATVTPTPRRPSVLKTDEAPAPAATAARALEYDLGEAFEGFPPTGTGLAEITPAMIGQHVVVTAKILTVRASQNDRMPHTLLIRQDPPLSVIYYPAIDADVHNGRGLPQPGQMITARGTLGEFRGQLQVKVAASGDIVLQGSGRTVAGLAGGIGTAAGPDVRQALEAAWATPFVAPIGQAGERAGSPVVIAGEVDSVRPAWSETAPNILTIQDTTGSVEVVFWGAVKDALADGIMRKGAVVVLRGQADEFQGRTQIKILSADDIQLLDPDGLEAQVDALSG